MDIKFAILIALVSLLVMGIYSIPASFVSAETSGPASTSCTGTGKITTHCLAFDDQGNYSSWDCTLNTKTKKWSCVEVPTRTGSDIPSGLKSALDTAVQESQNNPNTNDTNVDGGLKTDKGSSASPDLQ